VESRMRTSVASFTPESYDRKFMGSVPPLILDTLSQLEAQCGPLSHISVQYEKIDLILIPHNNQIIAISLETGPLEPILRKPVDIAKNLHVTPPTVTGMLNKLREEQFIVHEKYGGIVLTEKGSSMADEMRQRHGLLVSFLRLLGADETRAQKDTEGLEHYID